MNLTNFAMRPLPDQIIFLIRYSFPQDSLVRFNTEDSHMPFSGDLVGPAHFGFIAISPLPFSATTTAVANEGERGERGGLNGPQLRMTKELRSSHSVRDQSEML